jgi:hypothetical protein
MASTSGPVGRQSSDLGVIKPPLGFQDYADEYNGGNGPPVVTSPSVTVTPTSMDANGGAMLALAGSSFNEVTNVTWQDGPDAQTTTQAGAFNSWTMASSTAINVDAQENWITMAGLHSGATLYVVVAWTGIIDPTIVPVALT